MFFMMGDVIGGDDVQNGNTQLGEIFDPFGNKGMGVRPTYGSDLGDILTDNDCVAMPTGAY
jgi:hypothetical protein